MFTLPSNKNVIYALGDPSRFSVQPLRPFDPKIRLILAQLSERLMADSAIRTMPDVVSFAWWCRKANIERLATTYEDNIFRIGRGLAFHITPTNMPVNFAFSWAFSVLAGNANVVRVPNRDFPQIAAILNHLQMLFEKEEFSEVLSMNAFIRYGRDEEITNALSSIANVRLIWGGDATIREIRKAPLPTRGVDIGFADRYSFCLIGAAELLRLQEAELERLATAFYNDAYTMDQNACSSPHLVIWLGSQRESEEAQARFWDAVSVEAKRRYELSSIGVIDKYTQLFRDAIELNDLGDFNQEQNYLYRLHLDSLPTKIEERRCGAGYFYEYRTSDIDSVAPIVTEKYQTLTYFGATKEYLADFISRTRVSGIDRIVPIGEALNIGLVWDGYDLIHTLSRICHIY